MGGMLDNSVCFEQCLFVKVIKVIDILDGCYFASSKLVRQRDFATICFILTDCDKYITQYYHLLFET